MNRFFKFSHLLVIITITLFSCEKEKESIAVNEVTLNKTLAVLAPGEDMELTAMVLPENATEQSVVWTSNNPAIATIANGVITAVSEGTAEIYVATEDGNKRATCNVTVTSKRMTLTSQTLGEVKIGLAGDGVVHINWNNGSDESIQMLTQNVANYYYTLKSSNNITITGANVTHLACENISLTDLNICDNTALTYLQCRSNRLTSLEVSNNIALTYLRCDWNQLSSLDVRNNTELTTLMCEGNNLTSLDVSNNIVLEYLHCSRNKLTSLYLGNDIALTYLWCEVNNLTSLNVNGCAALNTLSCSINRLTNLDLSGNTVLKFIECNYNRLTSLNVKNNTQLTTLSIHSNTLKDEDIDYLLVSLHNNSISVKTIDISDNPGTVDCDINIATGKGWTVIDN